jgi:cell shape-determining protein MreC
MNWRRRNKYTYANRIAFSLIGLGILYVGTDLLLGGAVHRVVRSYVGDVVKVPNQSFLRVAQERITSTRSQLLTEINQLEEQVIQIDSLEAENQVLRAELAALRSTVPEKEASIPGRVISFDAQYSHSMVLDVGTQAGVQKDDYVLSDARVVVGIVTAVDTKTAQVSLLSTPGTTTKALMGATSTPLSVELVGSGDGNFSTLIPRSYSFTEGEPVVLGNGYIIARIGSVAATSTDSQKRVLMRSPFVLGGSRFVYVVHR